jgi:hypothetical protein
MDLGVVSKVFSKVGATNINTAAFPSRVPTITEPTPSATAAVVQLAAREWGGGGEIPMAVLLLPYGLGNDNDTYDMKLIGWRQIGQSPPQGTWLWVPYTLTEFTCTLGASTGVAGQPVLNTELFADTIVAKSAALLQKHPAYDGAAAATFLSDIVIYSPADDTIGWIKVPLDGCQKIELTFAQTSGTPTGNALMALV